MEKETQNQIKKGIILTVVGAIINYVARGGGYKQLWKDGKEPFNIPSKFINALLFGLGAYWMIPDWKYALAMGIAMLVGQAPALFKSVTDTYILNKDYLKWVGAIYLRGLIWLSAITLVQAYFVGGLIFSSIYLALVPLLMPVCYVGVWVKPFGNKIINNWTVAELTFGLVLWSTFIVYIPDVMLKLITLLTF
jgi:hypothetical protein